MICASGMIRSEWNPPEILWFSLEKECGLRVPKCDQILASRNCTVRAMRHYILVNVHSMSFYQGSYTLVFVRSLKSLLNLSIATRQKS